jgi:cell division protease FtsH
MIFASNKIILLLPLFGYLFGYGYGLEKPAIQPYIKQNDVNYILRYKNMIREDSYNSLLKRIEKHDVSKVYFTKTMDEVVTLSSDTDGTSIADYSVTNINPLVIDRIAEVSSKNNVDAIFLQNPGVNTIEAISGGVLNFATGYVFPFLFLSFIISLFRSGQMGGPMPPGLPGSIKKDINVDKSFLVKSNITLKSFAGSDEIMQECTEVVSYLKNSTIYKSAGAEIPKGILLEGPPGTGKTLLAKAVASEANANFISIAASEFVEVFVGVGASKIRNLFKSARENKPCIIFIDEIDAVGRQRGAGINMANDEREQTLNQLLAEMDGFGDNEGILVMAATNRKDVLDAALLRPGRFDRIITVPFPDKDSRKAILKVHSKNKTLDPMINMELIAELTNGFSGAQLKNLLNEAAIYAAREGMTVINEVHLLNSLDKLIVGLVKQRDTRSDESRRRVAIHEMGHAFLAGHFKEYFDLKKVTIQSTYNGAGGYTIFNEYANITESGLYTKDLLLKRIIITMGGKAAETIVYGDDHVSLGAVQDLKQANSLAQRMIGNYGMGNSLEAFYNENVEDGRNPFLGRSMAMGDKYSEKTKENMDRETLYLVTFALAEAKRILTENRYKMDYLVDELLKKTFFTGSTMTTLLDNLPAPDPSDK